MLIAILHREGAADNKIPVFGHTPGVTIGDGIIENTRVERHRMFIGKPLLNTQIFTDFMFRIQHSPDHGVCAVRADHVFRCRQMMNAFIGELDLISVVLADDFAAQAVMAHINVRGDQCFKPQIETVAVDIDVSPLVISNLINILEKIACNLSLI